MFNAPPAVYGFETKLFGNIRGAKPEDNEGRDPFSNIPHLFRHVMTSPILSSLVWEEVVGMHEGMSPGESFRKKPAALCMNMSY